MLVHSSKPLAEEPKTKASQILSERNELFR